MRARFHNFETEAGGTIATVKEFVHPSRYDVTDPQFRQSHCLRFEIDRSKQARVLGDLTKWEKNPLYGVFKITDIDFYLDGNKHTELKVDK